jgi:glycosyl transferase family WecB/TagA/CpsF
VHGVMESQRDSALRDIHNRAGLVAPDGMPLVWLSWLSGHRYVERVYGPDLMLACCRVSVSRGYRHYFFGGAEGVPERLAARLGERFAGLKIAGAWSPPFRELSAAEEQEMIDRTEYSEAGTLDGSIRWTPACAGTDWRRCRVRLPRRPEEAGAALDATKRPRVAVPPGKRASPPGAPILDQQSLVCVATFASVVGDGAARSRPGYAEGLMLASVARIIYGPGRGSQRLKSSGDTSLFTESGA